MTPFINYLEIYLQIFLKVANSVASFEKNGPTPASFSFIFGLFKQAIQFLQQINVKNVNLAYGTGIPTHDFVNMSCHR